MKTFRKKWQHWWRWNVTV